MKKIFASLLIFTFSFLILFPVKTFAKVIADEKGSVVVAKTEVINDDLFIGAQTVEISGVVNGDVFIGAQSVKITGVINGSLHVGTNSLDLSGAVKGNVYAVGKNISLTKAAIGGSIIVGAATINVDKDSTIGGSILAGAGMLTINSQVKRSVYVGTGNLTIGDTTKIGKDLYYAVGNEKGSANISSSAKIAGNVYKSEMNTSQKNTPKFLKGMGIIGSVLSLLGTLLVAFLYFKFFNKNLTESGKFVTDSFWKSLGVGFLVTIAFIPGLIVLLVTIVGIPLAGVALLILLLYFYLAKIVVGLPVGNWISKKFNWKMSVYGSMAFGILIIYIVKLIPIVGGLVGLVVFWIGLGALTLRMLQGSD